MEGGKRKLELYSKQDNKLKFTKFKPSPAINQKNYYTDYLKRDSQLLVNREDYPSPAGMKTIIISPGSRNLRVGILGESPKDKDNKNEPPPEPSEPPVEMPMCVARKKAGSREPRRVSNSLDDSFEEAYTRVQRDFTERMAHYKAEIPTDALEDEKKFNSIQTPQAAKSNTAWIENGDEVVCNLDVDPNLYEVYWPVQCGTLHESYSSFEELAGDLSKIFNFALKKLLGEFEDLSEYAAVLVIPDLYEQAIVATMLDSLVTFAGFGKVAMLQEALASTFAIGLSCACVVSVGAQSTSVACIDDGMSILDSRVNLKYGGDDITEAFGKLTSKADFPLDFDLNNFNDFRTLDKLKTQVCTANTATIAITTGSFVYSQPQKAEKYEYKLYNEAILPILGLFYPQLLFDPPSKKLKEKNSLISKAENIYDGRYDDPISDAQLNILYNSLSVNDEDYTSMVQVGEDPEEGSRQETPVPDVKDKEKENESAKDKEKDADKEKAKEKPAISAAQLAQQTQQAAIEEIDVRDTCHIPLDHAILQSVKSAFDKTGTPAKQFLENILIIGGGAQFSGFDTLLKDRLKMWSRAKDAIGEPTFIALGNVTPELAAWRGACVYASLPIMKEMWIEREHWKTLGSRVLQYKALFAF